jgi:hypothetical protein
MLDYEVTESLSRRRHEYEIFDARTGKVVAKGWSFLGERKAAALAQAALAKLEA